MIARLKVWAGALGVLVVALTASWFGGRKSAQTAAKVQEMKTYVDTRKRMDATETDLGDDPNVLRDWLRERGKSSSDM